MDETEKQKEYRKLKEEILNPDGTPKEWASPVQVEKLNQLMAELEAEKTAVAAEGGQENAAHSAPKSDSEKLKGLEEKLFTKNGKVRAGVTQKQIMDYHFLKKEAEYADKEHEFPDDARIEQAPKTVVLNVKGEQVQRTYVPRTRKAHAG